MNRTPEVFFQTLFLYIHLLDSFISGLSQFETCAGTSPMYVLPVVLHLNVLERILLHCRLNRYLDQLYIDVSLCTEKVKNFVGLSFSKLQSNKLFMAFHKGVIYLQKHPGCEKKCEANQKQHCKQAGATKNFDIS